MESTSNNFSPNLNEFQMEFNEVFTKTLQSLPLELMNYVKSQVVSSGSLFEKKSFQLELVVDTNILFSEVRSIMLHGRSFFQTLTQNPNLKVYSTSQLRYELHEKIKIKFPGEKATKHLNINECLIQADKILSKVEIKDDISKKAIRKAKAIMEKRDKDDVSFLALNIDIDGHGVLTKDKHFVDSPEIKTWELKSVGKVVTELNNGIFSFYILDATLPLLVEAFANIISLIWYNIILKIFDFIEIVGSFIVSGVKGLLKLPSEILMTISIALLSVSVLAIFDDDFRDGAKELLNEVWDNIKKLINEIKKLLKQIWRLLKEVLEYISPVFESSFHLLTYFQSQTSVMLKTLDDLKASQPENG